MSLVSKFNVYFSVWNKEFTKIRVLGDNKDSYCLPSSYLAKDMDKAIAKQSVGFHNLLLDVVSCKVQCLL